MTISMVQSLGQPTAASSFVFTKQNITVGNTAFIVLGEYDNSTTETITAVKVGTTAVTNAQVLLFPQINVADAQGFAILMVPNIQVSGQTTISWTYSGGSIIATWGCEVAGLGANPVLNQSASASGSNNAIASGTTPASTVANAFVLGGGATYNGSTSTPTGTTWANTDLGINSHLSIGWEVQTTIGQTYGFNQATGNNLGWAAGVVVVTPSPTLVQSVIGQGGGVPNQAAAIATTAGNAYVMTFSAWMADSTPLGITSVFDTAGNTWAFSTATFNQNPPIAANGSSGGGYAVSGIAWCLPSMQGTGNTTKAVTAIQVDWSTPPSSWGEVVALEFAGVPTNATALAAASTNTIASSVTSYTTPSITATTTPSSNPVLAVANTSSFGEFTAASAGWNLIVGSDTIGAYNLAASSGSVSVTFTQAAHDVPGSQIVAFGVGAAVTALTASATLHLSPTFAATRVHGHNRSATRGETPTFTATRIHGHNRSATRGVTPTLTAGRTRGRTRSGTRSVIPTFLGTRIHGHTRGATRAETPAFSAGRAAGRFSHAILSVVPSFLANRLRLNNRSATRAVFPSISATGVRGHDRSATRSEAPSISASAIRGHTRHATLTVSPTFFAGRTGGQAGVVIASATKTITPTFHASALRGHTRSASLSVAPSFTAGRTHGRVRSAIRSVTPTITAGAVRGRTRGASLAVSPSFSAHRVRGWVRGALAHVVPSFRASATVTPGGPVTLTFAVTSKCDVYVGMTVSATVECNVGGVYQAGMRSLATDRWLPMYPYSKGASS